MFLTDLLGCITYTVSCFSFPSVVHVVLGCLTKDKLEVTVNREPDFSILYVIWGQCRFHLSGISLKICTSASDVPGLRNASCQDRIPLQQKTYRQACSKLTSEMSQVSSGTRINWISLVQNAKFVSSCRKSASYPSCRGNLSFQGRMWLPWFTFHPGIMIYVQKLYLLWYVSIPHTMCHGSTSIIELFLVLL